MENQTEVVSAELIVLNVPEEISELSLTVSEVKRTEVISVISDIFKGTENWAEQISKIKVTSETDTLNIELAITARKNIKKARLEAEKIFNAKRSEVQAKMIDYKAEDQLWAKSKQIMQIKFKYLEELMEHEETFLVRIAQEKRATRTAERMATILKYTDTMTEEQIRDLDDSVFGAMIEGLKAKKSKDEATAKVEQAEREAKEAEEKEKSIKFIERKLSFAPYLHYLKEGVVIDYSNDTFDFAGTLEVLMKRHAEKQIKDEALRLENEKLKEATELLNSKLVKEKEEAEAAFTKAKKEADEALELERKKANEEKVRTSQEIAKMQADLEVKEKAEQDAKDLQAKAEKEALEAKEKVEKAPMIEKLNTWIEKMDLELPPIENEITAEIVNKFIGFKKWAKAQINKE
jgi:hypothetical protein